MFVTIGAVSHFNMVMPQTLLKNHIMCVCNNWGCFLFQYGDAPCVARRPDLKRVQPIHLQKFIVQLTVAMET